MNTSATEPESPASETKGRFDWLHVSLIVLLTVIVVVIATVWLVKVYLFPSEFKPVSLNQKEELRLEQKLGVFGATDLAPRQARQNQPQRLEPEAYSEVGANREVSFTEKELNAMVASNTDMAKKLAIDLSDDLVSAKVLIKVDDDFPVMAGRTIKVRAGMELAYRQAKPVVVLKGVSVMGVPVPNAWIGNLKNIDLVNEFGSRQGFWKAFSDGVEHIEVKDGQLLVKLKE